MNMDTIMENLQEADNDLQTLHALADMAEAASAGKEEAQGMKLLKHMAVIVHSIADDISVELADVATEILAVDKAKAATA